MGHAPALLLLWVLVATVVAAHRISSYDDMYVGDDEDTIVSTDADDGMHTSSPPMEFRMDNVQDLEEMQYLVEFVDPHVGTCPFPHPMELYFEMDLFEEEYSVERLEDLQEQYRDALPELKAEWIKHNGAARLDQLQYPKEFEYQQFVTGEQVPSAFGDLTHTIEIPLTGTSDGSNPTAATIDIDAVLRQLNGAGLGSGVEDLLKGLKIIIDEQGVHMSGDGAVGTQEGTFSMQFNSDPLGGGSQEPLVVDLNKILVSKERARYMSEAQSSQGTLAHEDAVQLSQMNSAAQIEAEGMAEVEYDALNAEWLRSSSTVEPRSRTDAVSDSSSHSRRSSEVANALNLLAALEVSCHAAHRSPSSWQCTHEVAHILDRIKPILQGCSVDERLANVESAALAHIDVHAATLPPLCDVVQGLGYRHQIITADDVQRRSHSPMDTLMPVVAALLHSEEDDDGATIPTVETVLSTFGEFVESHAIDACQLEQKSDSFDSVKRSAAYTASLLRLTEHSDPRVSDEAMQSSGEGALSLLNMVQAHQWGSTNAQLALATMYEFGFVGERHCNHASHLLGRIAIESHENLFAQLEAVYQHAGEYLTFDDVSIRQLRQSRSYMRSNGITFTLFAEDTLEDTRDALDATVAGLKERVVSSRSTYALYLWLKTLIPMFWRSLRFQNPTHSVDKHATVDHDVMNVHCWTWMVAARLFPQMATRHVKHITAKCDGVEDGVTIMYSILSDIDEASSAAASDAEILRSHARKSAADSYYYTASVLALMMLAYQEILLPCANIQHCLSMTRSSALDISHELLTYAHAIAEEVHREGMKLAWSTLVQAIVSGSHAELGIHLPWHVALCVATIDTDALTSHEDEVALDATRLSTVATSGFLLPEWFTLQGLVYHLRGRDVDAAHEWMKGATLELDGARGDLEDGRDNKGFFLWSQQGPMDATRAGRHGDCLWLLSRLVRASEDVFEQLRQVDPDTNIAHVDIPSVSLFEHTLSQAYADALLSAASKIFHNPSLATMLSKKTLRPSATAEASRESSTVQFLGNDLITEEANRDHTAIVNLADLRNVVTVAHEARSLQVFQWMTDRITAMFSPTSMVQRLRAHMYGWLCAMMESLSFGLLGRCFDWTVDPVMAMDAALMARNVSTMQELIHRIEPVERRGEVLQALIAVEAAHFWLQQGSAEAVGSVLSLDAAPSMQRLRHLQHELITTLSRHVRPMILEEAAALRIEDEEHNGTIGDNTAPTPSPRRVRLDHTTPFQYLSAERRLEALGPVAYATGMQLFQRACFMLHRNAHNGDNASVTPPHCKSPDANIISAIVSSPRRREYEASCSIHSIESDAHAAEGDAVRLPPTKRRHTDAVIAIRDAMGSFALCSGDAVIQWWSVVVVRDNGASLPLLEWSDDKGLLMVDPRCAIQLASMLNDYGDVLSSDSGGGVGGRRVADDAAEEVLNIALAASTRLRLFHRYDKAPTQRQLDSDDESERDGDDREEQISQPAAAAADDEDDPDDKNLEAPTLDERRRSKPRGRTTQSPKRAYSVKPAAWMDPNGIRAMGDGYWLSVRRNGIAAGWYGVSVAKRLLGWRL